MVGLCFSIVEEKIKIFSYLIQMKKKNDLKR